MKVLDIFTYVHDNINLGFESLLFIGIAEFTIAVLSFASGDFAYLDHSYRFLFEGVALFGCLVIDLVPTHDKILKLKLSKIKNEAVTKENVDQGITEVKRILKKFEKKYLKG
jgi:hypothetical protein